MKDFLIEDGLLIKYTGRETEVVIPETVTSVAERAFQGCTGLSTLTVPDSVTEIAPYAFYQCRDLVSLKLPDRLERLNHFLCAECSSLLHITIPNGVTEIEHFAFSRCRSLRSVTIPDSVTSIGGSAFYGCEQLGHISFPRSVTYIGSNAFGQCRCLETVTVPGSVAALENFAFAGCWQLHTLILEEGLPDICDTMATVFQDCYGIRQIIAPEYSPGMLPGAFKIAASVGYLTCPERYTSKEIDAAYCKYIIHQRSRVLEALFQLDEAQGLARLADMGKITAKNYETQYMQPALLWKAEQCIVFLMDWKSRNLETQRPEDLLRQELMKDPSLATEIKKLWCCEKLPDGTVCITGYKGNDTVITVPERIGQAPVTAIGPGAFDVDRGYRLRSRKLALKQLQSVTVPEGVTSIGQHAFRLCSGLTEVNLPQTVTEIGSGAFYGCGALESIRLPDSVKTLGCSAFSYCEGLESVMLSSGLAYIETAAFSNCVKLSRLTVPEGITGIGEYAFSYCTALSDLTLPDTVTFIGENAFRFSSKLTLHGSPDSYASAYAKENGITFSAL